MTSTWIAPGAVRLSIESGCVVAVASRSGSAAVPIPPAVLVSVTRPARIVASLAGWLVAAARMSPPAVIATPPALLASTLSSTTTAALSRFTSSTMLLAVESTESRAASTTIGLAARPIAPPASSTTRPAAITGGAWPATRWIWPLLVIVTLDEAMSPATCTLAVERIDTPWEARVSKAIVIGWSARTDSVSVTAS